MDNTRRELLKAIASAHPNHVRRIYDSKDLDDETAKELEIAVQEFMKEKGE